MNYYLCGPCDSDHRSIMKFAAGSIKYNIDSDSSLYCPFELKIPNAWDMSQEKWANRVFKKDIEALDDADALICISFGRESSAGSNWEQGYAFAKNKQIYVIQYADKPTSLMTYCGCHLFFAAHDLKELDARIKFIITTDKGVFFPKSNCETLLT